MDTDVINAMAYGVGGLYLLGYAAGVIARMLMPRDW